MPDPSPQLQAFFERLYDLPVSQYLRESLYLFPALDVLHVLSLLLMVGSVAVVDLRLLGLAFPQLPISRLSAQVLPFSWIGALLTFSSGVLLFLPQASRIYTNPALLAKLVLLVLAGVNLVAWHLLQRRHRVAWDARRAPPWQARIAGATSLTLWLGVIVSGRMIAFIF
ncbi:DUF6644 family protein [Pseudoxanthomonas sp.]|uniref:DUF6644 family protein n=1 Tax=Pseudoxanthomonas sp. TaxID=1871049 RepID=UPI0026247503|nr:DUF6644 family protein [Pseudoxanthomonas sp.]WDS37013.1 MAG: hypothetical protein O8I58_03650 [Pseudoxanthomonas sp.]